MKKRQKKYNFAKNISLLQFKKLKIMFFFKFRVVRINFQRYAYLLF